MKRVVEQVTALLVPDEEAIIADVLEGLPGLVPLSRAAKALGVSTCTLRRWAADGKLKVAKTKRGNGGLTLVPRLELQRLMRWMLS